MQKYFLSIFFLVANFAMGATKSPVTLNISVNETRRDARGIWLVAKLTNVTSERQKFDVFGCTSSPYRTVPPTASDKDYYFESCRRNAPIPIELKPGGTLEETFPIYVHKTAPSGKNTIKLSRSFSWTPRKRKPTDEWKQIADLESNIFEINVTDAIERN